MPETKDKAIAGAIIMAIATVLATIGAPVITEILAADDSSNVTPEADASAVESAPATGEETPSDEVTEPGPAPEISLPAGVTPQLHHHVYDDGSGATLCGMNFPKGETLYFAWEFHEGDGRQRIFPFKEHPSEPVNESGGFFAVSDHLPRALPDGHELPDGTVRVRVHWQGATPVYTEELSYDVDDGIDQRNNGSPQCPF